MSSITSDAFGMMIPLVPVIDGPHRHHSINEIRVIREVVGDLVPK